MPHLLIIQPLIPHYRRSFFKKLAYKVDFLILTARSTKNRGFNIVEDELPIQIVKRFNFGKLELFSVFKDIYKCKPQYIVSYAEVKQLTNFLLLFYRLFFNYKLYFWSQGFHFNKLNFVDRIRLVLFKLSDGVIFYTKNCYLEAQKYKLKKATYLNNTLDIEHIFALDKNFVNSKTELKIELKINTAINGIFISRFTPVKAPKLLLEIMIEINKSNPSIGFIIIGEGTDKPDFEEYPFIYDFGKVYEEELKTRLFRCSDFLLMPRWVGLSIVEAFAFGKPVFTLSKEIKGIDHSVEYSYITNNYNGFIADSKVELINKIISINEIELKKLQQNALQYCNANLKLDFMVGQFLSFVENEINYDK